MVGNVLAQGFIKSFAFLGITICFLTSLSRAEIPDPFPISATYPNHSEAVNFWIRIYTQYHSKQGLIHDSKYLGIVYEVIDLERVPPARKHALLRQSYEKWKSVLRSVHAKQDHPSRMSAEELMVFQKFSSVDEPKKFIAAAQRKRVRFQLGQSDMFRNAWVESGKYLDEMEDVFKEKNLPPDLARLPFVESSFHVFAMSKVGAAGLWQFMRSTGKMYLKITPYVDERFDPVRATAAASELLKHNYEALESWPLALIAYNHGRRGMLKAILEVGSNDVAEIVEKYRSRTFGFASKNFYFEFKAANEIVKNAKQYFPDIQRKSVPPHLSMKFPVPLHLPKLLKKAGCPAREFYDLNPGFTRLAKQGRVAIPPLYEIRVPKALQANFTLAAEARNPTAKQ